MASDTELAPAEDRGLPRSIAGFPVVDELGRGGMGSVYLARYLEQSLVAVKQVRMDAFGDDPERASELTRRFDRECRILHRLRHPAIVAAYAHGVEPSGDRYLVMEYVRGRTLTAVRAERGGPLTPRQAVELLLPVVDALCYCHARGVYHRDITPKNILVSEAPAGDVRHSRLVDFGASWQADGLQTSRKLVFGTRSFQPPERLKRSDGASDARIGATADVYGLAAVAWYLTGGDGPVGAVLTPEQQAGTETFGTGDAAWDALLHEALSPDPATRTPDMTALRTALWAIAGKSPTWRPFWSSDTGADEASLIAELPFVTNWVPPAPTAPPSASQSEPTAVDAEPSGSDLRHWVATAVLAALAFAVGALI